MKSHHSQSMTRYPLGPDTCYLPLSLVGLCAGLHQISHLLLMGNDSKNVMQLPVPITHLSVTKLGFLLFPSVLQSENTFLQWSLVVLKQTSPLKVLLTRTVYRTMILFRWGSGQRHLFICGFSESSLPCNLLIAFTKTNHKLWTPLSLLYKVPIRRIGMFIMLTALESLGLDLEQMHMRTHTQTHTHTH